MAPLIIRSCQHGVARIRLNRPDKRNALTRAMLQELLAAVRSVASNQEARVCIVEADGPVFCAGMDLGEMQSRAESADANAQWQMDSDVYCDLLNELYSLDIPTIAAVQGAAVAGGVGIVLACDMTVVADTAFFALPEPVRGITAAMVTPLLVHRVGFGAARNLLLTLERCAAERAVHIGLANDAVAGERLASRVDEMAASVLSGSRTALCADKETPCILRWRRHATATATFSQCVRSSASIDRRPRGIAGVSGEAKASLEQVAPLIAREISRPIPFVV